MEAAKGAAKFAYAPYSHFRVGAAVLSRNGKVYTGANIENASYGLSLCAERVALAAAKAAGEQDLLGIAVACVDAPAGSPLDERLPCGACRQWIQELAPDAEILILGEVRIYTISDFLPNAFRLSR